MQRILWYKNLENQLIKDFCCSRVIFGASPSPYILGATIERHLERYKGEYTDIINTLKRDTYIDDIQDGGDSIESLRRFKVEAMRIMAEAGFMLHKWHFNVKAPESNEVHEQLKEMTVEANYNTKILGISWNKSTDTLELDFTPCIKEYDVLTKRKMISTINSLYDVLGWVAPITITGKLIFSDVCNKKLTWDEPVPRDVEKRWKDWMYMLEQSKNTVVPRAVQTICAVEYTNTKPVSQHLFAAKSRIAPKGQSVPRLELTAAFMLAKLLSNILISLENYPIKSCHYWVDSIILLYWLPTKGSWTVYIRNRVKRIKALSDGDWKYVPTKENLSDLGTRGVKADHT